MNTRSYGMRPYSLLTIACIAALVLQACSSFTLTNANKFQKGMPEAKVRELSSKSPQEAFSIALPSDSTRMFKVLVFELALGSTKADYFAVFEKDALLYWGHPYEFNRYPDPLLNEIGKTAVVKKEEL